MATTRDLTFPGSTGAELRGVLHVPDDRARGSVLLAHCFTCSKDLHTMTRLARGLSEAGYAVLRFDFTGLGDSGGEFSDKTLSHNVRDLTAAATALIKEGFGPCGLLGHSLGGAASLLAAKRLKTVRSVVVLGAPASPDHLRHLFVDHEQEIRREGQAVVAIGGRPFPISKEFIEDLERHDEAGDVAELGRPLLVVHAVDDEVVEVDEGERIFGAATQPKGFHPLIDGDHLVTDRHVADEVLQVVRQWFDRTLSGSATP
ncbi:MAG: alpha/beta hydrolase [Nitriliruptorales bacterium]|nr:alpha/beta hydrolase [Nitriliruptorales bacterium]